MSGRESFDRYKQLISFVGKVLPVPFWGAVSYIWKGSEVKLGILFRYIYYSKVLKSCGGATFFGANLVIKNAGNISVGDNCSIHAFTYIDGAGGISIGDN